MRYISPFHYLPLDIIQNDFVDTNKIKLVRKRLLAEIELSETQSIFINEKELSKFDVITLFDGINDAKLISIHAEIYNDKLLLNFLENGIFTTKLNSPTNLKLSNEFAINFISPYYKEVSLAFINDDLNNLKQTNNFDFQQFFKMPHLLTNEDIYEVYEFITKKITSFCKRIIELENKVESKNKITQDDIDHLKLLKIVGRLNALPDDFGKLREDIATKLNSLGCDLINSSYNRFARHVLSVGQYLKASEYINGYLTRNLAIAKGNTNDFPVGYGFKYKFKAIFSSELKTAIFLFTVAFFIIIIGVLIFSKKTTSYKPHFNIEEINMDLPTANWYAHYPIYGMENANFNALMFLLYTQDTLPLNSKEVKFNKGDNVFQSLFGDFAFSLKKIKSTSDSITKSKKVLLVNRSEFDCILIIRNATIKSNGKLDVKSFTSQYIPSNDSLDIILKNDFNDIRPYMGKYIVENTLPKKADIDFYPKYLFKIVPKNYLLWGIGLKLDLVKNERAKLIIEQDTKGQLNFIKNIIYFLQ